MGAVGLEDFLFLRASFYAAIVFFTFDVEGSVDFFKLEDFDGVGAEMTGSSG